MKTLNEILKEQMQAKGVTMERLRHETGISERYLSAFVHGQKDRLPAAPYVRGYLLKLALALELDGEELWNLYRRSEAIKSSGAKDIMPYNRFALKKISKKWILPSVIIILAFVYGIINFNRFLGTPKITITGPAAETLVTTANTITLLGKVNADDKLIIDGKEIIVDEGGNFKEEYQLEPGLNRIEFRVKRLLSREVKVVRQVIYQP